MLKGQSKAINLSHRCAASPCGDVASTLSLACADGSDGDAYRPPFCLFLSKLLARRKAAAFFTPRSAGEVAQELLLPTSYSNTFHTVIPRHH